jgi:drug/metabolite transporter (DMT)-like permease
MKFQKENWESTRKRGFLNFLVVRGFLFFGLPFSLIQLLFAFNTGKSINFIAIILSGIFGSLIYGSSMWYFAERKFKKENSTNKP